MTGSHFRVRCSRPPDWQTVPRRTHKREGRLSAGRHLSDPMPVDAPRRARQRCNEVRRKERQFTLKLGKAFAVGCDTPGVAVHVLGHPFWHYRVELVPTSE
jgi:hypothetical protein